MINKILKTNALVFSYEMLSDEGKVLKRSQAYNYLPENASAEDLYEIGSAIGDVLASAPKELRHNLSFVLVVE